MLTLAIEQHGTQAGLRGSLNIIVHAVPDVQSLFRIERMLFERELKNFWRRLGSMGQAGDRDSGKQFGNTQSPQDREEPRIKVGNNAELDLPLPQSGERRHRIGKQFPGPWGFKHLKDALKKIIEPLEHADAIKYVVHDVKPPEPFALLDLCRFGCGENGRWSIAKGPGKCLVERGMCGRRPLKAKFHGVLQINLPNRSVHMKQRIGSIKKNGLDRLAHSYNLASRWQIVASENILNEIALLTAIFLTKDTPPASFELAQ